MTRGLDALAGSVPDAFLHALAAVMPDARVGLSEGADLYFPCDDPAAYQSGHRLFHPATGSRPDLAYELAVDLPEGTVKVQGTWHGATLGGHGASPQPRVWVVAPERLGRPRVVRSP